MAARGFVCYGSVSGALGRLADLANDSERACALYGEAIEVEQRAGALVWATHHRFRLGEALLASAQIDRGLALLAQVRREGLPTLAQLAAELIHEYEAA